MYCRRHEIRYAVSLILICWSSVIARADQATADAGDQIPAAIAAKLDRGLDPDSQQSLRVFVRLRDQMFVRSGDYERFAAQHSGRGRRSLRMQVLNTLRGKSKSSWQKVAQPVQALEIEQVRRYWIVNGFACRATGAACAALAKLPEVDFVYLQRGGARQERFLSAPPDPARAAQMRDMYRRVLSEWKDDSAQPFSAAGLSVPWNVTRIRADLAWKQEQAWGQGVTVALMDSGLMETPSLTAALWKNPDEQLNQKDDDGNGLIDDIFGYDFAADSFYAIGDGAQRTHGSMCGGIIAGRPLNTLKLATGVAPRSRLMMLRGMGLLRAYEYAVTQGADVVSMSYMYTQQNIGHYRGLYRLAHEHLAAAGVISVGGAGNFGPSGRPSLPDGRQIATPKDIPCVIAAAGIHENGQVPGFSSRGPCSWTGIKFYDDYPLDAPLKKPDVCGCIGGFPVWGRPSALRKNWTLVARESEKISLIRGPQGNSFSGPHAAGVVALMLSVNPDLNAWDIQRLLQQTCRDLGPPGWDPIHGAGLLDALKAVRAAKAHMTE